MPQKTNLNINPYYDDFDKEDNFYKVLFKPGFPIQARELTTLQSILQNQIESFGSSAFKEGSMVIPGGVTYNGNYSSIKVNTEHLGINVSVYADQLIGKTVKGQTSGVTAKIDKWLDITPTEGIEYVTLFVNYTAGDADGGDSEFEDGEVLIVQSDFVYGTTTVNSGETVASLIAEDAVSIGTNVGVEDGVYFVRGSFVDCLKQKIVLDPYTTNSSYRVGFTIFEELVTATEDNSLYDNAKGYSNYAAPGADRLKISLILSKKLLTDFDDKSFVELIRVENGVVKKLQNKSIATTLKDYIAKRTYDESGNYALNDFSLDVSETLNDEISNGGIYTEQQTTASGNTPSEDLITVKVSPGTAYVKGYDISKTSTTNIDVAKPRETKNVSSSLVPFDFGTVLRLNNVQGTPFLGINNVSNTVQLQDQRRGSSSTAATGTQIGEARVYSFGLTDAAYSNAASEWDLYLFDVQTYTTIVLNETVTTAQVPASSYIRGVSSGASGYVVTAPGGSATLSLTQTSGTFIQGEQILINESLEVSRSIQTVTVYGIEDVKSVYQNSDGGSLGLDVDFIGDTVLQKKTPKNFGVSDTVQITTGGVVTCPGKEFSSIKVGSIIRYQIPGVSDETFNRVTAIGTNDMTVVAVETIANVCSGALPAATFTGTFSVGAPKAQEKGGLYSQIEEKNVSHVNLSGSNLAVSQQIGGQTTDGNGALTINISQTGISSAFFESFDQERYGVFYDDGTIEDLTSDQVTFGAGGASITLSGLTPSQSGNVTVNTTVKKNSITSKSKVLTRSEKVNITNTVSAASTEISGLNYSQYYGTRVEDKEICLNFPDVVEVVALYESLTSSAPTLDYIEFPAGLGLDTNSILGERVVGSESRAIAQVVTRVSPVRVEIVYLNSNKFEVGELAKFQESNIESTVQKVEDGDYQNVTSKFTLDKGTKDQYYDYSKLIKNGSYKPSHRLLAIVNRYSVPSNDEGNVYTVNSYSADRFKTDIPVMSDGTRSTDTLDFRPRVAEFTSTTSSPFTFASRNFATAGVNPTLVVAPGESSLIGYDFYLPRIDKVVLSKEGKFTLIEGDSAVSPQEPKVQDDAMVIGTIALPAYLYDVDDAVVTLVDNRRYTMRDIGGLEDRIETLELTTSLSLLEVDTKTLQVQDSEGFDKFKTGFFVDDFKTSSLSDPTQTTASVNGEKGELNSAVDFSSFTPQVALDPSIDLSTANFSEDNDLLDPNVQKTGNIITLKYEEKDWIEQPLATKVENVNPFNVVEFTGFIDMSPSTDSWTTTIIVPGGKKVVSGSGAATKKIGTKKELESSVTDPYIRSRNVTFSASGLKPLTNHFAFFNGTGGIYVLPKIVQVTMQSGVFEPGETVIGTNTFIDGDKFKCRIANANHKTGPIKEPTTTYSFNPYNPTSTIPQVYSESSTVLNFDVKSLEEEVLGEFRGYVFDGMTLYGETSGAQCFVTLEKSSSNTILKSDALGDVIGSLFFENPNKDAPTFKFTTGTSTFKLTSSVTNKEPLPGSKLTSQAEGQYTATGKIDTFKEIILLQAYDPLAQTFTADETGAFVTGADVYFANKDESNKCFVELRTVELGTPTTQLAAPYAKATLEPETIQVSEDASVATHIKFPSPIYLEAGQEYALVLISPYSDLFEVWIAEMGEKTVNTENLPDAESVVASKQYTGGSLFKSQNGSIWTTNQYQDMKFKLYKAEFVTDTPGVAYFYNPAISDGNSNGTLLQEEAVKTLPRKLRVGIDPSTNMGDILTVGKKVSDSTAVNAIHGYIEQIGGPLQTVTTSLDGVGYSDGTYTNVPLYNITGNGTGAQATVVVSSGTIDGNPTITNAGTGYVIGDILGITTSSVTKGTGAQISVSAVSSTIDTLYLTNVQGEEFTVGDDLVVYNNGTATSYANTDITSSDTISDLYEGNVIEIQQINHGMHSDTNLVTISGLKPNTVPSSLNAKLTVSDATISVANTSLFQTFQGITTQKGYVQIDDEVIYYDSVNTGSGSGDGTLTIAERGVAGTTAVIHEIDAKVYSYQLNGFSLVGINTQHNLPNSQQLSALRDYDTYHLQLNRGDRTADDGQLSFTDENFVGGGSASASRNIQFNTINPEFSLLTPDESVSIKSQMRTVSATSAGGAEVSFIDQGFENVTLNSTNEILTPRLVASEVNETEIATLSNLPKGKSFTLALTLQSSDANLSPAIDVNTSSVVFGRSRLNNPVSNYSANGLVNSTTDDPHLSTYVTNLVNLKQPATSIKVLVDAYRHSSADFRVLYQLVKVDSNNIEQAYELFPGYDNLKDTDGDGYGDVVVDETLNNGKPDAFVPSSADGQFLEYQFTADNLEQFSGFRIKIVSSGTNEARAPRFKNLKVIALA